MAVALRRPESLELSLDFAYNVLRRVQANADPQFIQNLRIGLDYLFAETEYRETSAPMSRYRYDEIPHIRWLAARLAKCLSGHGHGTDPVIRKWCEAATVDPLPEMRRIISEPNSS